MTDMNPYLAAMYNTNGAAEQITEDMQKVANMELFCKLAADNGLDLSNMTDDQIASVYAQVFPEDIAKVAEEEEKKEEEKKEEHEESETEEEEKKEEEAKKAEAYYSEKRAWAEKCAEADYMGRIMAHAFTQERDNIEKEADYKTLAYKPGVAHKVRSVATPALEKAKEVGGAIKGGLKRVGEKRQELMERGEVAKRQLQEHAGKMDKAEKAWERGERLKGVAAKYAPHAGAATLAVGGEEAVRRGLKKGESEKKGSAEAFDEMAANYAIKMAEAAGWDVDEAVERISAIHTLGLSESEKIAHVQDLDTATHVRALEYLEAASYPVNWEEIFGG
jgi:hypothetical protein